LFTVVSDGSEAAKPVLVDGKPLRAFLADWSPDGSILAQYTSDNSLCYIKRGAAAKVGRRFPLSFRGDYPKFSPDGRFLAYVSDEAGGKEVYVRAFPDGGDKRQISQSRGGQPRWSKNGRELFYVEGDALFAVPVSTKPAFSMGPAKRLFSDSGLVWGWAAPTYDVSADGQRFVTMEPVGPVRKSTIHVVLNWFAEFSGKQR
jgi:serine/threonine-protein kinase